MAERLAELREMQDEITAERRDSLIGERVEVLVDSVGEGRTFREAPEIDGVVRLSDSLKVGELATVQIVDAEGPDLVAEGAA
jgi:ribosomal protein S12 methylthiotransferase